MSSSTERTYAERNRCDEMVEQIEIADREVAVERLEAVEHGPRDAGVARSRAHTRDDHVLSGAAGTASGRGGSTPARGRACGRVPREAVEHVDAGRAGAELLDLARVPRWSRRLRSAGSPSNSSRRAHSGPSSSSGGGAFWRMSSSGGMISSGSGSWRPARLRSRCALARRIVRRPGSHALDHVAIRCGRSSSAIARRSRPICGPRSGRARSPARSGRARVHDPPRSRSAAASGRRRHPCGLGLRARSVRHGPGRPLRSPRAGPGLLADRPRSARPARASRPRSAGGGSRSRRSGRSRGRSRSSLRRRSTSSMSSSSSRSPDASDFDDVRSSGRLRSAGRSASSPWTSSTSRSPSSDSALFTHLRFPA